MPPPRRVVSRAVNTHRGVRPEIPRRRHRTVRGALVRTREPLAQKVRRFNWCAAIKRHQRGWHAGESDDVRAPAVLFDSGDLDDIWTSPDGFFEAMNGCGHSDQGGGAV